MNEQLMAYLYGELSVQEKAAFEKALQNEPELQQELKDLQSTRHMLHQLEDVKPKGTVVEIKSKPIIPIRSIKWLSAAAAVALLLLIGKPTMEVNSNGFMIAFGESTAVEPKQEIVQPNDYEPMIHNVMAQSNQEIYNMLDSIQQQLGARINTKEQSLMEAIERELEGYDNQHQRRVARVVNNQYEENMPRLVSMTQDLQLEQRREVRKLLNRFWQDIQRQREADMQAIEKAFLELQQQQGVIDVPMGEEE